MLSFTNAEKKGKAVFPGTVGYNSRIKKIYYEEHIAHGSLTSSDDYDSSSDISKKEKKLPQNRNKHNKQPKCETSTTASGTNSEKNSERYFSAEGSDNFSSKSAENKNETPSTTPSNNNANQSKGTPFDKITMSL